MIPQKQDEASRLAEEFVANFNEIHIDDVGEFGSDIQLFKAGYRAGEKSEKVMRLVKAASAYLFDLKEAPGYAYDDEKRLSLLEDLNKAIAAFDEKDGE